MFAVTSEDEAVSHHIDACVKQSQRIKDEKEQDWEEAWSNYRVEPYYDTNTRDQQKLDPYAYRSAFSLNQLKTPESHQIANTLTSIILASVYGVREYVQADPVGHEDVDAARKVSKLTMYGLERPGGYRTDYEELKDAIIFGSGVWKAGWKTQIRTVPRRLPIMDPETGQPMLDPETGQPITIMRNVTVPVYDDIKRWALSLYDTWFDTSVTRIDDCKWVTERMRIGKDELRMLQRLPTWKADKIAQVLAMAPTEWAPSPGRDDSPKLTVEGLTKDDLKNIAEFGYYGAWQLTGEIPSDLATKLGLDPLASAQITMVNGVCIQATQNPQKDGEIPYGLTTVLPTGGMLYGLSPLTVIKYLQDVSDTQLILTIQAMIEAVYQNYLIGGAAGTDNSFKKQLETRRPREAFVVPGDVTQVIPLPKDYTGLGMAAQALQLLSQTMRNATAARDPVQGIAGNDRTTATEANLISSSALQNVDQLSSLIERDELPRKGRHVAALYYVNLPDEGMVLKRVGDREATSIGFFEIDQTFDIQFVGASSAMTQQQKASDFKEFMSLLMMNPLGAASIDFEKAARWFSNNALHAKGLEDLIITNPMEVIARIQASGGGAGAGNQPAAAEGPTATESQAAGEVAA